MPLEKKKSPYMDELLFKRFPVAEVEAELEGIKSPVFIPSEEVLDFGEGKTVSVEEAEVVYHQDETKIYELPEEQMKPRRNGRRRLWRSYTSIPRTSSPVPIVRPLSPFTHPQVIASPVLPVERGSTSEAQ